MSSDLTLGWLLFTLIVNLLFASLGLWNHSLLLVSGWKNLGVSWETEFLDEILKTIVGEEIVGPSPGVDLVEAASALQGFGDHHSVEVSNGGDVLMSWEVCILLDDDDTLSEEVFENGSSAVSGNEDHVVIGY